MVYDVGVAIDVHVVRSETQAGRANNAVRNIAVMETYSLQIANPYSGPFANNNHTGR